MKNLINIDSRGRTTARELYEFLELNPAHFARWSKSNIVNNDFAEEGNDYLRLTIQGELFNGGKVSRDDFDLSIEFAKKLCMTSKSPRGEEARDYFIEVERRFKESTLSLPQTYLEALESLVVSTKALAAAESTVSLLMHPDKTYTSTEIAKELGFRSAQRFNDWLRTRSIIFDVNGTTVLRSTYADRGYYSIKQCIPESGNVVYNSKWTQEGRRFLVSLRNQG